MDREIPEYAMIPIGDGNMPTKLPEKIEPAAEVQLPESPTQTTTPAHTNQPPESPTQTTTPAHTNQPPESPTPTMTPAHTPTPPEPSAPARLLPATDDLRSTRLRLTEKHQISVPDLKIEEDLLVPDKCPDLEKIVSVDAKPEITGYESYPSANGTQMLKISGNFEISTLYLPAESNSRLMSISSKIPFRYDAETQEALSKSAVISAQTTKLNSKVINERKIRITAEAHFTICEYGDTEIELLEGVRDESLLLKNEKLHFTDVAQRRTDTVDLSEKIRIKDGQLSPSGILKYDVNIVENHRQTGKGKAIVDATAYYSILYEQEPETPVFYRGKTDFTQFIRLPELAAGDTPESSVTFEVISSSLNYRDGHSSNDYDDEEMTSTDDASGDTADDSPYLQLDLTIAATIQIYRDIEREIVTDMYHRTRDLDFTITPHEVSQLCGCGAAEVSVRDTVNIPENKGTAATVPYISVKTASINPVSEQDRCVIEGVLAVDLIYTEEETGEIASCRKDVNFRSVIDLPGAGDGSSVECIAGIRDIWFDRMNGRQVDFNCGVSLQVYAWNISPYDFIDKVCYVEYENKAESSASMVVYMAKPGDTQWSVAKRFRTTMDTLRQVNGLTAEEPIEAGRRLLIV